MNCNNIVSKYYEIRDKIKSGDIKTGNFIKLDEKPSGSRCSFCGGRADEDGCWARNSFSDFVAGHHGERLVINKYFFKKLLKSIKLYIRQRYSYELTSIKALNYSAVSNSYKYQDEYICENCMRFFYLLQGMS